MGWQTEAIAAVALPAVVVAERSDAVDLYATTRAAENDLTRQLTP